MTDRLGATTLVQRLTLLGIARLSEAERTPAHAGDITRVCAEEAAAVEGVIGTISEADVSRALNELDAEGHVETPGGGNRSPVGKGRPTYELAYTTTTLIERFEDDDRLQPVVENVAEQVSEA